MDIKSVRNATGLSQKAFSERFGIPIGTLRNWEQGINTPPSYVFDMIFAQTKRNCMINIETLEFLKTVENIAEKTKAGIEPFANATEDSFAQKVFFDDNTETDEGEYGVVCDACITDDPERYHHDIVSYHGNHEYRVCAKKDEDEKWFVLIRFFNDDAQIVVEDGKWYFV